MEHCLELSEHHRVKLVSYLDAFEFDEAPKCHGVITSSRPLVACSGFFLMFE